MQKIICILCFVCIAIVSAKELLTLDNLQLAASERQQPLGDLFPIDSARNYRLCLEVRATGGDGATFWPILEQYDNKRLPIASFQLNAIAGTETTLLRDVHAGDTELLVADSSKWLPPEQGKIVAFNAATDLSDLPNRNIEYYARFSCHIAVIWELSLLFTSRFPLEGNPRI